MNQEQASKEIITQNPETKNEIYSYVVNSEKAKNASATVEYSVTKNFEGGHKLVISVPTYHKELENRDLLSQIRNFFNQSLRTEQILEINYIINSPQEQKDKNPEITEKLKQLLKVLTLVQNISENKLEEFIEKVKPTFDNDQEIEMIIRLAHKRRDKVRLGYVDVTQLELDHFDELGYSESGSSPGGSMRTIGADHARRFGLSKSRETNVFLMGDSDSQFLDKNSVRDLIDIYRISKVNHHILRAAYNTSMYSIPVNAWAVKDSQSRLSSSYNRTKIDKNSAGSPQISMSLHALEEIDVITSSNRGNNGEDMTTGDRLEEKFAFLDSIKISKHINQLLLTNPVILIKSKPGGFYDSEGWSPEILKNYLTENAQKDWLIKYVAKRLGKSLEETLSNIPKNKKSLEIKKKLLYRQYADVAKIQKIRRMLAIKYLSITDNLKLSIDETPDDLMLQHFIKENNNLEELKSEDIEYLRFILGLTSNWKEKPLTEIQMVLRENFGLLPAIDIMEDILQETDSINFIQRIQQLLIGENKVLSTLSTTTFISLFLTDLRTFFFQNLLDKLKNHELEYYRERFKTLTNPIKNDNESDDLRESKKIKKFIERTKWTQTPTK